MRLSLLLLLITFAVFFNTAVLGSAINLRTSKNVHLSATATEKGNNNDRVLQAQPKLVEDTDPDDEERGVFTNLRSKLNQKALNWLKTKEIASAEKARNKKIVEIVKTQDLSNNMDGAVQALRNKDIHPDFLFMALKLDNPKNIWVTLNRKSPLYKTYTPQYKLWMKLLEAP